MAVEKLGGVKRECDAGREEAMRWACGCRGYSGEGMQASRCNGRWLRRGNSGCARYGYETISDRVRLGPYKLCTGYCRRGRSGVVPTLFTVTLVL